MKIQTAVWKAISALVLAGLVACGGTIPKVVPGTATPPVRYDYALTLEITSQDVQADIEARYGASALIWKPEAGFAVLGVEGSTVPPDVEASRESNRNAFSIPGANAQGRNTWAGGRNTWAGGWNAWAGGVGTSALTTLEQNLTTWQQVKLAEGQAAAPNLGRGVKVAVIDTGVDVRHPALQGKLAPENEWRDFVDGDALPLDELDLDSSNAGHGHGTGVAGIILQVAPKATILPLRVLKPDGSGDLTDVAMAISWAAERGADILNLSLGATSDLDSKAITKVLAHAHRAYGVYVVVSSGNAGTDKVTFPANLAQRGDADYLVSVGSVNAQNVRSTFSTYGVDVSLYAPGEKVYTLMPERGVAHTTGTSFAAPIVAGTLALALSDEGVTAPKQALLSSANTDIDSRDDTHTGMLDAGRFLGFTEAQNEVALSSSVVLENQPIGTVVGRFSVAGSGNWRYTLVEGTDNGSFTVLKDELRTAERFDFETKSSYRVVVEMSDGRDAFRQSFTLNVQDLDDEAPGVTFTDPGELVEGEAVTLTGSAADNVGVSTLELYEDEARLAGVTLSGGAWSYRYTPRSAGTFTLKVIATDAAGNSAETTRSVSVRQPEVWPAQFGSAVYEKAESVATDLDGNVYMAGHTEGSLAGVNAGSYDALLAKYDSSGEQLWVRQSPLAAPLTKSLKALPPT